MISKYEKGGEIVLANFRLWSFPKRLWLGIQIFVLIIGSMLFVIRGLMTWRELVVFYVVFVAIVGTIAAFVWFIRWRIRRIPQGAKDWMRQAAETLRRFVALLLLPISYPTRQVCAFLVWVTAPLRRWKPRNRFLRAAWNNKLLTASFIVLGMYWIPGIFADWLAPYSYTATDLSQTLQGPSATHWLGTDQIGRDFFTRVLYANRTLVVISGATVFVGSLVLPIVVGLYTALKGGRIDALVYRLGEFLNTVPPLLLMILISRTMRSGYEDSMDTFFGLSIVQWSMGRGSVYALWVAIGVIVLLSVLRNRLQHWMRVTLFIVLGFSLGIVIGAWFLGVDGFTDFFLIFLILMPFAWYGIARLLRSEALKIRRLPFVLFSETIGTSTWWIMTRHLLPNVLGLITMSIAGTMGGVAGAELALTFLGFGVQEPTPSYGAFIQSASNSSVIGATPYLLFVPAIAVVVYMVTLGIIGFILTEKATLRQKTL